MKKGIFLLSFVFTSIAMFPEYPEITTVTDIDGNIYHTVTIGSQIWMRENLKTTHFRDGSAIGEVEDSVAWASIYNKSMQLPAWCYYESKAVNNDMLGKLYNWYAVQDNRNLCPAGWHIPTDFEWSKMTKYMGGDNVAGGAMKAMLHWNMPNTRATDMYGFTGLPGGIRYGIYNFYHKGNYGYFWTSSEYDRGTAWFRNICNEFPNAGHNYGFKVSGMSVRCIKD